MNNNRTILIVLFGLVSAALTWKYQQEMKNNTGTATSLSRYFISATVFGVLAVGALANTVSASTLVILEYLALAGFFYWVYKTTLPLSTVSEDGQSAAQAYKIATIVMAVLSAVVLFAKTQIGEGMVDKVLGPTARPFLENS